MSEHESLDVAIGPEDGQVCVRFPHAIERLWMAPQSAIDISEGITRVALTLLDETPPVGSPTRAALVQRHYETLVPRVALMIASMRDQGKSDGTAASEIVTQCLSEVF